jgi:hypothetical protein
MYLYMTILLIFGKIEFPKKLSFPQVHKLHALLILLCGCR